jgi:flagellar motor protein MotB
MNAVLTRAVESARLGRYQQALTDLEELGGHGSDDPRVLDLLARVHAQQGELADADECWSRAFALDGSPAAAQGRRRIAALQAKRFRPRTAGIAVLVVAVAGIGVVGVLLPRAPAPAPVPGPDPAVLSGLSGVAAKQADLEREIAALGAKVDAAPKLGDQLVAALASGKFTVRRQGEALVVTFTDALFTRDARLTAAGRAALDEFAQQVKPFASKSSIAVTGHTDDRPVPRSFTNDVDLGFGRAQAAASELSAAAGISLAAISLRSAGAAEPPYSTASKARNNTVTVLITPG